MSTKGKKGNWAQAIITFFSPFLIFLIFRWCVAEPFVIPSGSMIPTLNIHDHVIVTKFSYGLKIPFSDFWLVKWKKPQRGEVVVFRFPQNPDVFYIKRLVGLPGDTVVINDGRITVNDVEWSLEAIEIDDHTDAFDYYVENSNGFRHQVRFFKQRGVAESVRYELPEGKYLFVGDNRDQSSDGRFFGLVDEKLIVGPAKFIWMSCEETLQSAQFICDPQTFRWNRIFTYVE